MHHLVNFGSESLLFGLNFNEINIKAIVLVCESHIIFELLFDHPVVITVQGNASGKACCSKTLIETTYFSSDRLCDKSL
ncbi:MAG: hypothetical protein ACR5K4_02605 [Sodalis sp. (in: enterobacteria)]